MERILVTGANGLIGYDVAKALKGVQNYDVFTVFHSPPNDRCENALQMDLESTSIKNLETEFDYVVHCAAMIPNNVNSDEQVAIMNRHIDDNIIDFCSQQKCKLIFISSIAVYENNNKTLLTEQTKLKLDTGYKLEKRRSEIKIEKNCRSYCILRISSPYGPRQKNVTVLKKFIDAVYANQNICYFGTGNRTQDFVDVRDISQAVLKCIGYKENGIFNIASGNSISMKQLADLILRIGKEEFDTNSKVQVGNNIDLQEDVRINIDNGLARRLLGWESRIKLEDGIRNWMRHVKGG